MIVWTGIILDLIKQLNDEHKEILYLLSSLESAAKTGVVEQHTFLNQITELKELLVNHLAVEDNLLYSKIRQSKSAKDRETGEAFSKEMGKIAEKAMKFFNTYDKMPVSSLLKNKKFISDFEEITSAVRKRVAVEESVLFKLYN